MLGSGGKSVVGGLRCWQHRQPGGTRLQVSSVAQVRVAMLLRKQWVGGKPVASWQHRQPGGMFHAYAFACGTTKLK